MNILIECRYVLFAMCNTNENTDAYVTNMERRGNSDLF